MESSGSAMVRKIGKILWYTFKLRTFSIWIQNNKNNENNSLNVK